MKTVIVLLGALILGCGTTRPVSKTEIADDTVVVKTDALALSPSASICGTPCDDDTFCAGQMFCRHCEDFRCGGVAP